MAKIGLDAQEVICLEQLLLGHSPEDIVKLFAGGKEEEEEAASRQVVQTIHTLANRVNDLWGGNYDQGTLYGFYLEVSPRDVLFLNMFLDIWDRQKGYIAAHDTLLVVDIRAYGPKGTNDLFDQLRQRLINLSEGTH